MIEFMKQLTEALELLREWDRHTVFHETDGWEVCRGCGVPLDEGELLPDGEHYDGCLVVKTRAVLESIEKDPLLAPVPSKESVDILTEGEKMVFAAVYSREYGHYPGDTVRAVSLAFSTVISLRQAPQLPAIANSTVPEVRNMVSAMIEKEPDEGTGDGHERVR